MRKIVTLLVAVVLLVGMIPAVQAQEFGDIPVIADTSIRKILTNDGTRVQIGPTGLGSKQVEYMAANGTLVTRTRRPNLFHLKATSPFYIEVKWANGDSTGTKHVYVDTTRSQVVWQFGGSSVDGAAIDSLCIKTSRWPVQAFVKGLVDTMFVVGTAADSLIVDPITR